jgi:hypothetical protein
VILRLELVSVHQAFEDEWQEGTGDNATISSPRIPLFTDIFSAVTKMGSSNT